VDRSYKIGYAQTWNVGVQRDLPYNLTGEATYIGTKGTRLDMQRMPNRAAPGSPLTAEQRRLIGNAVGFTYESAEGTSIYNAGQFRLSRRFRRGVSGSGSYTFAKSIDNASSIGGGGVVVAQNDQNLAAERGLSSFDRRHNLSISYALTSPTASSGTAYPVLLRDWQFSGGFSVRSGPPYTAQVLGNRSDTGGSGSIGSGRADATGLPITLDGFLFNPAAFAIPPAGRFGDAARNTIPGPWSVSGSLSAGRSFRFKDSRRGFDLRASASNVFNSVNVSRVGTTVNASNYGLPLSVGSMRTMTMTLRFRF
jgi:hypothetical protein